MTKYRFVEIGEVLKEGDQYISYENNKYTWIETCAVGTSLFPSNYCLYRRPIKEDVNYAKSVQVDKKLKKKYRILEPSETIKEGDQLYNHLTRGWGNADDSIGWTVQCWLEQFPDLTRVRRPVKNS